ncbi:MAG: creatininase family protein [Ferrovibrio sp.]|uniref:creatininase family protein n=1 Tax=Ferrovibrio sp. TaxID=1917215 RepID=UPI00261DF09A|nr:creatininase family protein [Ferrovibrio sp.]MCW0236667.1 creatininase family protein [Ferrovibrio sp.]
MQLHLSTWAEVETYLKRSTGIIIPIGSTEQHGPNGLIGTDAICAEVFAAEVGRVAGALVGPTINVGMAQHHLGFPGSMTLRPTTLIAVIRDMVASLSRHGFDRFFFLNGHGGNIATATAAFSEIYAEASLAPPGHNVPSLRCTIKNWWEAPSARRLSNSLFPGEEGSHATPSEVSVTYHAYPQAVKDAEMTPRVAPNGGFTDAADYRSRFADGRIGSNPALATKEHGKTIMEAVVPELADSYRAFLAA